MLSIHAGCNAPKSAAKGARKCWQWPGTTATTPTTQLLPFFVRNKRITAIIDIAAGARNDTAKECDGAVAACDATRRLVSNWDVYVRFPSFARRRSLYIRTLATTTAAAALFIQTALSPHINSSLSRRSSVGGRSSTGSRNAQRDDRFFFVPIPTQLSFFSSHFRAPQQSQYAHTHTYTYGICRIY